MDTTTSGDAPAIRTVLAGAYASDPLLHWIFPEEEHRVHASAAWLGLFAERYVRDGRVDAIEADDPEELAAVALWRMPDDAARSVSSLPSFAGLLAALVGRDRAELVGRGLRAIAAVTPKERHAYLHFVAVSPSRQGRGLGRRVVEPGVASAAARGLGVHLETTNPANLSFYRSLGFEVTDHVILGPDGPPLWAMWRDPAAPEPPASTQPTG